MHTRHAAIRRCTIYHRRGEALSQSCELVDIQEVVHPQPRTGSDAVALGHIMSTEVICARSDLRVAAVVELMVRYHVGCIPIVDESRRPIGVITKFDLVEQIDAGLRAPSIGAPMPADLRAETAEEVMMPLALTLTEEATVAHAASMMAAEDTHHVLVVSGSGMLVGVVSTTDIVRWLVANDGLFDGGDGVAPRPRESLATEKRR